MRKKKIFNVQGKQCLIQETDDSYNSEIIELFSLCKASTDGRYPPPGITADHAEIKKWLGLPKTEPMMTVLDGQLIGYVEVELVAEAKPDRYAYWQLAFGNANLEVFKPGMNLTDIAIIKRIVILPEFQQSGIGRISLEYLISEIKAKGKTPGIVVLSALDYATEFYKSAGGTIVSNYMNTLPQSPAPQELHSFLF